MVLDISATVETDPKSSQSEDIDDSRDGMHVFGCSQSTSLLPVLMLARRLVPVEDVPEKEKLGDEISSDEPDAIITEQLESIADDMIVMDKAVNTFILCFKIGY